MTNADKLKAKDMQAFNRYYYGETKGTLSDYITAYKDFCRNDGDYTKAHQTKLYNKHSGEYCGLVAVLASHYRDHQKIRA